MKGIFVFLFLFTSAVSVSAQSFIQQFDIDVENVFVRADTAYQMLVKEIDIPADGHVISTFEGECFVSHGDVITLAVSKYKNWSPNYGNVSAKTFDSIRTAHPFHHTMVFPVQKGKQSFYALAHNWTDRAGTGYTSVHGKITLQYIPAKDTLPAVFYHQLNKYPLILNETDYDIDTLEIITDKASDVLLSFDGSIYSTPGDEIEFNWYKVGEDVPLQTLHTFHVSHNRLPIIAARAKTNVEAGTHYFVMKAKKLQGNMTTTNNAVYGTLFATIFHEENEENHVDMVAISGQAKPDGQRAALGSLLTDIPADGQLIILCDGSTTLENDDSLDVFFRVSDGASTSEFHSAARASTDNEKYGFFSAKQVLSVRKGQLNIQAEALLEAGAGQNESAQVTGSLAYIFFADPVISSVQEHTPARENEYRLFPNPATEYITLLTRNADLTSGVKTIFTVQGTPVRTCSKTDNSCSVSDLQPGSYIIQFMDGDRIISLPFIKMQ